ncbi:hypothetical protein BY996DRAFT_6508141 [Phakopsora pachyrhizi]|nr:hypothetical protein BY996DRAFT_6508141 [Phakopsora pachyrhizi]
MTVVNLQHSSSSSLPVSLRLPLSPTTSPRPTPKPKSTNNTKPTAIRPHTPDLTNSMPESPSQINLANLMEKWGGGGPSELSYRLPDPPSPISAFEINLSTQSNNSQSSLNLLGQTVDPKPLPNHNLPQCTVIIQALPPSEHPKSNRSNTPGEEEDDDDVLGNEELYSTQTHLSPKDEILPISGPLRENLNLVKLREIWIGAMFRPAIVHLKCLPLIRLARLSKLVHQMINSKFLNIQFPDMKVGDLTKERDRASAKAQKSRGSKTNEMFRIIKEQALKIEEDRHWLTSKLVKLTSSNQVLERGKIRIELIGDFYKMCNGYYRLEPAGFTSVVPNPRVRPAIQFPGATKTSTKRNMSHFELERQKAKKAPLPSVPIVNPGASKSYNLRTRSQYPTNPIPNSPFHTRGSSTRSSSFYGSFSNDRSYHPSPRSSSSLLDELRSESFQKIKDSPSKPHQELKDLYQSPYLKDGLIASPSYQTRGKKEEDQDQKSKYGVERASVKNLYQNPVVKASLSEYAASSSKEDISRLEDLRKEHKKKASKLKEEATERLKVLRSLKKEAEDDFFDLVSRKTSMSRRTSVAVSLLPTRMPSISAGSTTDKRKISPTTYETVTQSSSIKPRTEHEELMRYIPQPLQRLIEKIGNPPKDGDCGYTCVAWSSGQGRGISAPKSIRKHLSAELKKYKKMYEMIEGRNIDEDIRNIEAEKSVGVASWLKMPLFGHAIANHLRRTLYYFSLDSMDTYVLPTNCSYSSYPQF